jgi:NAD(P)-dependent dehydrogenase (short-subunit alcohol dehydrogenase family)
MQSSGWCKISNMPVGKSYRAFPNSIPHSASKGGVAQLTRATAEEFSKDNILCVVNAIGPGLFPTEMTAKLFDEKKNYFQTS